MPPADSACWHANCACSANSPRRKFTSFDHNEIIEPICLFQLAVIPLGCLYRPYLSFKRKVIYFNIPAPFGRGVDAMEEDHVINCRKHVISGRDLTAASVGRLGRIETITYHSDRWV